MSGSFRSKMVKEVDPKILGEFYEAANEFMAHPAHRSEPCFLNLLEKSLAIADEVSSVNKRVAKEAQTVRSMKDMSSIAALKSMDGISEGCLTPESGYEMRNEDLLLASLNSPSCFSSVRGLLDGILLVAHESGNPKELMATKAVIPVRPRDRLMVALEQRRFCFGYEMPLGWFSSTDLKPGFGC